MHDISQDRLTGSSARTDMHLHSLNKQCGVPPQQGGLCHFQVVTGSNPRDSRRKGRGAGANSLEDSSTTSPSVVLLPSDLRGFLF